MKRIVLIFSFIFTISVAAQAQEKNVRPDDYPIPPATENQLFFIQRNRNKHTILYDARLDSNGKFKSSGPIDVYWLRYYSSGIEKRDLKWIEQKFAYGYSYDRDDDKDAFWIELAAFNGRKIYLTHSADDHKPLATLMINDRKCKLDYIWVFADESGVWPKVIHVDLHGTDLVTGEEQKERIVNK